MRKLIEEIEEEDPLSFIANLFDIALVLALAFMVMLLISYNMEDLLNPKAEVTMVKNPGKDNMQIIIKKGEEIKVMNLTKEILGGEGVKIGTAYRLKDGTVIYVPENESK